MLEELVGLLPVLGSWLKDSIRKRRLLDERGQRAVDAILRAVNETKLYLAVLSRGISRDMGREADLARYWTDTAGALRGIDDALAQRCRLKGQYWTSPETWDVKQLKKARILLTQVSGDADVLLGWKVNTRES